uniref:Poly [ADP-ribose] polymerase n=1 Tax=Scophthalmus maximus TaxID=52904 RepID=A0A8D3A591_SCOMX
MIYTDGVCKDILAVAGPEVTSEVQAGEKKKDQVEKHTLNNFLLIFVSCRVIRVATVKRGEVLKTRPGSFPCRALLHVCGQKDAGVTEKLVHRIVQLCNTSGYKSVAIPAICTGSGGLDPGVVAAAILRGVERATSSTPNSCLADIRLVLRKIDVFLEFREKAMQVFPTAAVNRGDFQKTRLLPLFIQIFLKLFSPIVLIVFGSCSVSQSAFLFVGLQDIPDAMAKLKDLYQAQCSSQTFTTEQLEFLSQDDVESLKQVVEAEGLYVQSGPGGSTVSGLKDGVNRVMQMINASLQGGLRAQQRVREEEDLYTRVAWCILGNNGNWERLPKVANRKLENSDISGAIVDARATSGTWIYRGRRPQDDQLDRNKNFTLPLYWDNMAAGESMKVVTLEPSSAEYHAVKEAFKRTAPKAVMKINRLQNVHLRRAYESQKKHISDKNVQGGGAGERLLYHGTTQENCDSIMTTGFNRRFAGQNATLYGLGTYFAVNAVYSAHPTYSKPNASGCQLMFVARVLTGLYTVGQGGMMVPPPRNTQRPHDLYDSVVDNTDDPNMYVVFHDDQAYPDYLITFK